ncbi:MAG: glycosyltransferase family 4 protein [Candidatus Zixiibacteriota bacterium]|nr:MAG: glycosyltransferase family 4 protein [candidate division Zixibacteria bacterium]
MKVVYLILNSLEFDSRARLEIDVIGSMGHDVEIICTVGAEPDNYNGHPIHRIKQYTWPTRKIRFAQFNLYAGKIGARLKGDIYHAVDLDVLLGAYRAARKTGGKLIYEARELYTELEPLQGRNTLKAIWRGLERRLIGKADRVITINESIAGELRKRYGIDKPAIIRNMAMPVADVKPVDLRKKFNVPDNFRIILYQGVLRSGQGLLYQLEIMKYLDKVAMLFLGAGPIEDHIRKKSVEYGMEDRVILAGRVSPDELLNYTASADAGLLLMEDTAMNNRLALPQKLFQYLAAGIPQIVSPLPEISRFVKNEDTGIVIPLGQPREAAEGIAKFLNDSSRYNEVRENCRKSAKKNNWENESRKLIEIYRELGTRND